MIYIYFLVFPIFILYNNIFITHAQFPTDIFLYNTMYSNNMVQKPLADEVVQGSRQEP